MNYVGCITNSNRIKGSYKVVEKTCHCKTIKIVYKYTKHRANIQQVFNEVSNDKQIQVAG